MPRITGREARAALGYGKDAEQALNFEEAVKHFDSAIRLSHQLSGEAGALVRAEATYLKGKLLFSQSQYAEALPLLRAYLEQDIEDALSFGETAKSFVAIAEMECDPDAMTAVMAMEASTRSSGDDSDSSSDAETGDSRASQSYQVDLNPAHQDAGLATDQGERFDGRLSGSRLRISAGRRYSAPESTDMPPEGDTRWYSGRPRGGSSLQAKCCGERVEDQCLCCWSVAMASVSLCMCLYGIVA